MRPRLPLKTRDDLSMVYTPGVARVSRAIAEDPEKVWNLTIKRNSVAIVSDGTAVLGLGDIGPEAALPVMEGKAVLFKEFAGVDAFPICLATKDPDEIVRTVEAIAPAFGGINLEDISAPRCFEVERRLRESLDIPVFHDDQHGTAIVVLAALLNALRVVDKRLDEVRIVITGCGAAGMAVTRIAPARRRAAGSSAATRAARSTAAGEGLNAAKQEYAEQTNPENLQGSADELLAGADVFIGVSVPGAISVEGVRRMAPRAIVFAMANPNPEVDPEAIEGLAEVIATGRCDYPNQINNVLAFPGVFRGALDVRARTIDAEMELAAARAIAGGDRGRRALRRLRHPERLQPRRRAGGRRRGSRGGAGDRHPPAAPCRPRLRFSNSPDATRRGGGDDRSVIDVRHPRAGVPSRSRRRPWAT